MGVESVAAGDGVGVACQMSAQWTPAKLGRVCCKTGPFWVDFWAEDHSISFSSFRISEPATPEAPIPAPNQDPG